MEIWTFRIMALGLIVASFFQEPESIMWATQLLASLICLIAARILVRLDGK